MHNRVAYRYLYARLFAALSKDDAKRILGFPPGASPSSDEVMDAWRAAIFKNHPDRGGDPTKTVELNVAKDVLQGTGVGAPRSQWRPEAPPPRPKPVTWKDDPETVIVKGQTFAEAMSSAGVPAGTVWKFISIPSYYYQKTYYPSEAVWVLYGQTKDKHVFLALKRLAENAGTIPTDKWGPKTHFLEDWQSSEVDVPIAQDPIKAIPKNIKLVSTAWADGAKPKAPSKFLVWPGGIVDQTIVEKTSRSGGVALKDILVSTGILDEGHEAVQGRKSIVEIYTKYDLDREKRRKKERAEGTRKHVDVSDSYLFFVRVNGRTEQLSDDTIDNLKRRFIPWVMSWEVTEGAPKNLTRMRGGMRSLKYPASMAIRELANCLTSEPSWLHIALEKAAEEWEEPEAKKASWRALVARTASIVDAAYLLDMDPVELFRAL